MFLRPVNRRAAPGFEPLQERVVDEVFHFEQGAFADGGLQLALPDGHHPPAHTFQGFLVACVPFLVPLDFLLPEFRVGTGYVPVGLVSVPEAAMDEDDDAVLAHHDVGRSGHTFHVLTVAVAP